MTYEEGFRDGVQAAARGLAQEAEKPIYSEHSAALLRARSRDLFTASELLTVPVPMPPLLLPAVFGIPLVIGLLIALFIWLSS